MSLCAPDGESPAITTSEASRLSISPALNGYAAPTAPSICDATLNAPSCPIARNRASGSSTPAVAEREPGIGALQQGDRLDRRRRRLAQSGQREGHQAGAEAVPDEVDTQVGELAGQPVDRRTEPFLSDHTGSILHLPIGELTQRLLRAV